MGLELAWTGTPAFVTTPDSPLQRVRTNMDRIPQVRRLPLALGVLLAILGGCRNAPGTRPYREPPPPGVQSTIIDYVDADGFDALFESALTNQDPVIDIRT